MNRRFPALPGLALLLLTAGGGLAAELSPAAWQREVQRLETACARQVRPADCAPVVAEAYLGLGWSLVEERRFDAAREALREGREYAPEEPRFALALGYALYRSGDYAAAEVELGRGLAAERPPAELYRLLAESRYALGELRGAAEALEAGLAAWPEEAELARRLAQVRREGAVEEGFESLSGGHFSIRWDGTGNPVLGERVLDILEEAYVELGAELNSYPPLQLEVILYPGREFQDLTGAPHWAGGIFDGKIRLPVAGVGGNDPRLAASLYHEYAHALVHYLGRGRAPVWFNEGLAERAGRRHHDPPLAALQRAWEGAGPLPWDAVAGSFTDLAPQQVPLAYEQSYAFVNFLAERYGAYRLRDLLEAFAAGRGSEEALLSVYRDLGLGGPDLRAEWRAAGGY